MAGEGSSVLRKLMSLAFSPIAPGETPANRLQSIRDASSNEEDCLRCASEVIRDCGGNLFAIEIGNDDKFKTEARKLADLAGIPEEMGREILMNSIRSFVKDRRADNLADLR